MEKSLIQTGRRGAMGLGWGATFSAVAGLADGRRGLNELSVTRRI